jgi:geranylgeranyl pyrophosphate synthase
MELPVTMSSPDNAPWREIPSFVRIDAQLAQVNTQIHRSLAAHSAVGELSLFFDHLNARTGKLIRPGLVLLAGECFGPVTEEHIRVSAMVEMIHHATLLHDDVIDDGHMRRGAPTVNRLWGNESAVLLGDFVLSRVFRMTAELDASVARIIAQTAVRVCEGELRQVMQRQNWRLSEAEYLDIITEKSASFFSSCCRLGAVLAHAEEAHVEAVARFGLSAGIAFQIADDLLDIVGDETRMGKTARRDVAKDKPTLAVIHLLDTAEESRKPHVRAMLESGGESRRELAEMLRRGGSLRYAQERAEAYVAKAIQALADLPPGEARDALIETARFMADRTV